MSTDDNLDTALDLYAKTYNYYLNSAVANLEISKAKKKAKASINKEALRIALEIIGEDEPVINVVQTYANNLRAEYRKAFEDRYK